MRLLLAGGVAALTAAGLATLAPAVLTSEERAAAEAIRDHRVRADIRFLASDLLEGRGPASRGDALARAFVTARFEALGLEPGAPDGTWLQPFDLMAVKTTCPEVLSVAGPGGREELRFHDDYVAFAGVPRAQVGVTDAEIVFVGYGIEAPEYDWDDYEGADLEGKVLLFMNDDPGSDPEIFGGARRLYYGRWDYKFAMAARHGAAGALILHTPASASYGWSVVQSSWTGELFQLPSGDETAVPVKAWVTEDAGRRIARLGGHDLDRLRASAESRAFRPVPLGVPLTLALTSTVERRRSANVIARLPGSAVPEEAVIYTAHHDHLGMRTLGEEGATVYNGALDNASGLALMLAVAEAFVALPEAPRRSILFAAVGAEEQGLLGSEYLARQPPLPPGRLAANINLDGANIWGRTRDVAVVGLGKSTLDDWIRAIAQAQGRTVRAEQFPEKGSYYRSDHFSLAKVGVPGAYIDPGTQVRGRPAGWGRQQQEAWVQAHYHQPSDDLTAEWNLEGAVEDARLLFHLGVKVADAAGLPEWRPGDEFEAARRRALAELDER